LIKKYGSANTDKEHMPSKRVSMCAPTSHKAITKIGIIKYSIRTLINDRTIQS